MLGHRYKVCRHYKIDPERGYLGKYITEVWATSAKISPALCVGKTCHTTIVNDLDVLQHGESNYTAKWVQLCKPWEAHREQDYKHVGRTPPRGVLDGITRSTLGPVFGHYSFAQCLLVLGAHHVNIVQVFKEEVERQYLSQQELQVAPYRESLKRVREDLQDRVCRLRHKWYNAKHSDERRAELKLRECEDHLLMAVEVSGPGRDTAPRGTVARVARRLVDGYSVPDRCTAKDCEFQHELAICYLCSHMVCRRPLPKVEHTLWNNSSSAECSGPWGPEGPQDMQEGSPAGASCVHTFLVLVHMLRYRYILLHSHVHQTQEGACNNITSPV